MLGTKRPASSAVESTSVNQPSKRLKPNHQHQSEESTTASGWLPSVWNGIKNLLGSPGRTVAAAPSRDQSRSRQKPRQRQNPLPTFEDINDDWIWRIMTAKQRGQPPPKEPAVLRELRERKEREQGAKSNALTNGNSSFLAGQNGASQNGSVYGSEMDGQYRRKKPMGSRKNTSTTPTTQSTRKPSRRKRIPTPDLLKTSASSLDSISVSSASSSSNDTQRAQQSLFNFVTHTLPISTDSASSSDSSSSDSSSSDSCSSTSNSSDSDSSSTTSSHSVQSPVQPPTSSSLPPCQPTQLASSPSLPSSSTSFFSSPWLPKSTLILKRKQHRLALQSRDLSTLESLRSMPSTPTTTSNNSGSSGGGIRDEERDREFRVYKAGVRNLVRQEDEGEQDPQPSRPSKPTRTTSSLLGPASTTYASVLSSSKPSNTTITSSIPRPRTRVERTLDNYHKTQTESPAKQAFSSSQELFSHFERLRVAQEEAEKASLHLDEPSLPVSLPPRRRKWPKKVPREIQDRVSEMLRTPNYERTIPGAFVDTKSIRRMKPATWLDDSVVAFYGTLLTNRSIEAEEKGEFGEREMRLKKIWCFNSFFWSMYNENGYKRVKKWTKKFDVFAKDMIIFPININNSHWTCAAVNIRDKRFEYYDSLGGKMKKAYSQLRKWLQEEHEAKKGGPIDLSDWVDYWDDNVPQQDNSNDCGVFTCAFMESLSREVEGFDFDQKQMPYLRQKIAYEIDQAELKPEEKWVDVEKE